MGEKGKIDAMAVWTQVAESEWCQKAYNFYWSSNCSKNRILMQGKANFDKKLGLDGEKELYRAAYYAGCNGYMNMHIHHNLSVLPYYLSPGTLRDKNCLFVDLGCGPMTSGVVFAEILSRKVSRDYRQQVTYIGIDCSRNMCKIAKRVNEIYDPHCIFDRFHVKKGNTFSMEMLPEDLPKVDIAVLCLSFVLAPETYKAQGKIQKAEIKKLARMWHETVSELECKETRIIYMNPDWDDSHSNWKTMVAEFKRLSRVSKSWHYKVFKRERKEVVKLNKYVTTQMIKGTRKG